MATTDEERFLKAGDEAGTAPSDRKLRPDVEGMRAVAILLVVFSHFWIPGFYGGGIGVDVFFVISGYVITGVLLRERDSTGHTSLLNFYARRGRRIIPLAMLIVVVTMVLQRITAGRSAAQDLVGSAHWVVFFAFNFDHTAITGQFFQPQPFASYWSLAVEEQFYLVYPALILLALAVARNLSWRLKASVLLVAVVCVSLAWSIIASRPLDPVPYVSSFTRAWELAVGCLIAWNGPLFLRIPKAVAGTLTWAGLGLVILANSLDLTTKAYPGWLAVLPVAGTALVIIGGMPVPGWGAERLLALRPLRAIGRWSYGMYLWEIPVYLLAVYWWGRIDLYPLAGRIALVLLTVVIAAASFKFYESPIRHSALLAKSPALSLACAAVFLVVALATISLVTL